MITIANSLYSEMSNELQNKINNASYKDASYEHSLSKEETIVARIKLLSKNQETLDVTEWFVESMEYTESSVSCACGKANLKKFYKLKNRHTSYMMIVGESCLKKHFKQEPKEELIIYQKTGESDPYHYLGKKYNALILSALGYKKAHEYFTKT